MIRRSSPWSVLSVALLGIFAVSFTITLLAVSLGTIAKDLDSSPATLTWVITGPLLAYGVIGPVAGKAGDLWGHKRVHLVGIVGATLFSLATASAWNAGSLIVFRILGAAAGSACGPVSMAMINSAFSPSERSRAMGYWSMVVAGGPVLGVVIGGPVVEAWSWRWVFVAQAPMGIIAFLLGVWILPRARVKDVHTQERTLASHSAWWAFDFPGALLLSGGVTSLLLALNRASAWGWISPEIIGGFVLGATLLFGFIKREGRAADPLISINYLRNRNVATPAITQLLANFAYMGGFILTPFFLADAFGYGPTRIGMLSISRPLAFAIAGPIGGMAAMRLGERRAGMTGAALVVVSMLGLGLVSPGTSDIAVILSLALSGIGLGVMSPAMVATVANAVDERDLGVVGATQQLAVQIGVVAGIQILQTTQTGLLEHVGLVNSYHWAYGVGALVAGASMVSALFIRDSGCIRDSGIPRPALAEKAAVLSVSPSGELTS